MAQRDYEEQPEAPDLGASIQLESEQHLAAPPGDRDALDAGYTPPDRPYVADTDEMTARGMREGDTLDERLRREVPDDEVTDPGRAGRITIAGEGAALETPDAMDGVDVGVDGGAAGAEEAAVHVVDDPGAPLETEPSVAGSPALDDPELDASLDDPEAARAAAEAAQDVRADGDVFDPGPPVPAAEGAEDVRGPGAPGGDDPRGGDRTGRGPDPARPRDPFDADPAQREFPDGAEGIDAAPGSGGAASPASGREDAGPGAWR
jgi:hypothetical protein